MIGFVWKVGFLLTVIGVGVGRAGFLYICFMFNVFATKVCVSWSSVVCVPISLFWW